jgi:hypothetical protein
MSGYDDNYGDLDVEYEFAMNHLFRMEEARQISIESLDVSFQTDRRSRASELLDSMNRTRGFMERNDLSDFQKEDMDIALSYMERDYDEIVREEHEHQLAVDAYEDEMEAIQERLMGHSRLPKAFR